MLPTLRTDPRDRAHLSDLGKGLSDLLTASRDDPTLEGLLGGRHTPLSDVSGTSLPRTLFAQMEEHGLLAKSDRFVVLPFQIRLVDGCVIVTDHPTRRWRAEEEYLDPLWGGPTLNKLMVRGPARRALDLGCGSGVMAIAAAAFCERVVGVDVNPRAVAFSRFNLALNGVENADIHHSDLFEAVRGQQFDRIIFNSPTGFELRPRNWLEASERVLERFFSEVLHHLDEDGYAQVSLCFMDRRHETFWSRLARWLGDHHNGLQVVFIERMRIDKSLPLFAWRVRESLKDRANGFDVMAVSRGWLVLTRGAPIALRVPLDYKGTSTQLSADFGDVLIRRLLASGGHVRVEDLQRVWSASADEIGDCVGHIVQIPWRTARTATITS